MTLGRRLAWTLDHLEEILSGSIVIAMATLAFVNVLARYLTNYALAFTEETEVAALVWLTMLGAAIGFRRSAHIGFSILRDRLPRGARRGAVALSTLLTSGAMLALVWGGVAQIRGELALGTVSESLAIPEWLYTLAIPIGALVVLIRVLQAARGEIERA